MYRNCMFCHQLLGENQVVEHFPVGRRLAFDAQRGRLWVVCRKCERWNLTPMEERWEAVEDCERLFEVLRTRVSTENIGLGRHPGGVDLIRIGQPMRPEFAAWRYGDQFGRRRRKYFLYGAAGVAVVGGILVGGAAAGIISGTLLGQSGNFVNMWVNGRTLAKLEGDDGKVIRLKKPDLDKLRLVQPVEEGGPWSLEFKKGKTFHHFDGEKAREVASLLVPRINRSGAAPYEVQDAVKRIEDSGHPEAFLEDLKRVAQEPGSKKSAAWNPRTIEQSAGLVHKLPTPTRLALEMALHEEDERRALQGELAGLKAAWKQAEEIAEIADNLLLPDGAEEFLETHRTDQEEADRDARPAPPSLQS